MISQIDIEKTLRLQPNKECLFVSVATVLNHVVDAVNKQEQVIKTLIDGLERFAKSQQEVNMEITAMITKGGDNE